MWFLSCRLKNPQRSGLRLKQLLPGWVEKARVQQASVFTPERLHSTLATSEFGRKEPTETYPLSGFCSRSNLLVWGARVKVNPREIPSPQKSNISSGQAPRPMLHQDHCRAWQLRSEQAGACAPEVTGRLLLSSDELVTAAYVLIFLTVPNNSGDIIRVVSAKSF